MAKRQGRPSRSGANGGALPQHSDVWQVDTRQLPEVNIGGMPVRPWAGVVVSLTDGLILGLRIAETRPSVTEIRTLFTETMSAPDAGTPHRPTAVQFCSAELANALRAWLDTLGITCDVHEELEAVDHLMAFLGEKVSSSVQAESDLLDVEGMTPEMVGSFYDAAALYHEQTPWKKVGERPIRVSCERFGGGPWYAVLMGQGGMTSGLALYDDLETLDRIQQGDLPPEEMASMTAGWAVVFGDVGDLSEGDAAAAQRYGWRVAGPQAYPSVYRTDAGMQMRPPTPDELLRLEACLRAVPEFVRKKSRRTEPTTITVPTAAGEVQMGLSWVDW